MQGLPGDGLREIGRGRMQRGAREQGRIAAVECIAEQRMAERGEVDADLVCAAGARQDTQERVPVPLGEHGVIRDGRLTVRRGGAAGGAVVRAGDGQVNGAAYRQAGAAGGGEIRAPKAVGVQHAAQPVVHIAAAGDEHDAGCATVEPVDGVKNRVGPEVSGKCIGNRGIAAVIPAVHGHAGGLIEREQVSVLIQDIQRHGHGWEAAAGALVVDAHGERIPCLHAIDGAGVRTVEADAVRHGLDAGNGPVVGRKVLGYGGDFGERTTDYNFSGNGIVYADGAEKPAMQDVRYWYASPADRAAQDAVNAAAAAQADRTLAEAWQSRRAYPLVVTQGDGNLGVKGKNFEMLFSIAGAGPASLKVNGTEWLWRAPRPAFWRASTDNDRGCGFPLRAAAWMAADVFVTYSGMKVLEAGPDCVKVQFQFGIPTVPGASAELVYTVEAQGALRVDAVYRGVAGAPELPCFGVKFETFGPVTRTVWTGLSGETYPDRYKGGMFGCHEETPHVEPHLVPQDCGMHMQTRQAMLEQRDACGHTTAALTLQQVDAPFAFSALPNTAQEIEAAQHITELPATGRTSVMVLGAVRGVGGIDSWGTDVEEPYHVSGEEDHSVSFRIVL